MGARMKILKYQKLDLEENRIELYYNKIDQETENIIKIIDSYNKTLTGRNENETTWVHLSDIYYCEIIDRKCYAYLKESIWQVDISLQMLLDQFGSSGFVRISKSMVVNIHKIERLKTDLNMRVNIILDNGETVILNRTYRSQFYQYLEKTRREMK
ncbi:LytTR family DNA-binding domain-containing protein [Anaeromicropila herbilytica]|uniref:LytTR family transcriptional regulator n=1 Tax=Anaeromicropila herbilytica TaxID=2785025 RepID=A0A7R7EKY7_9FIRM|nr:LytTR family DNA-binding domain-containing protein [Anaeromicropila herbilytica]BCN30377.1 LytTR family transcriptional regulator [Anaeromicropila herbilytica]